MGVCMNANTAVVPANGPVKYISDLILRSLRSKRLEGWTQRMDSRRDARKGALLRMRSAFFTGSFAMTTKSVAR
jgi:hypothetical protein